MRIPVDESLTEAELDRLGEFLSAVQPSVMNIERLDGYFTALVCGPVVVPPSQYLPEILGEDHSFDSGDEATEILGLLMRHWNDIARTLSNPRAEDAVYFPVLIETDDGIAMANNWAKGFMQGMRAGNGSWNELLNSDEHGGPLLPIMILAHEHDPDPALRPPPIAAESREELIGSMVAGIVSIYRYFAPHRKNAFQNTRSNPVSIH